ncbi:sensor domain-containing diguanylate cyclase [Maridesulfovibrio salexigens]|uniref:diguanylate cyclase n=1 Tax=Maridesulfovibrio salexigens (strain ATCC 14822 / DSM 2638 / NCIMB 8403 / VKM B-1763) TaxID=526222 RepID=C6C1P7_MARSD|nr:sensor domain-containing diguanylate cyclase [Maridesulfovibrio salexigens]ACS79293.1 diguanylate cyclase with PAS/PAC sensor [Maridesulfovibrio salexigens DSM 2638]
MKNLSCSRSIYSELAELRDKNKLLRNSLLSKCPDCGQFRFRELFSNAASAITILNKKGEIIFANSAFATITSYDQDEIIGKLLNEILVSEGDTEGREYLHNLFCGPAGKANLSIAITDKNNDPHYIDMSVSNIAATCDTPENCICIMQDVTSEKEAEHRREELIEELMEVKELQEDNAAQLATLLHELDEKNYALELEIAERKKAEQKLKESEERFKNLSITDQLTGLFNRRHMLDVAEKEIFKSRNTGHPLSIMLMDVDDFKMFNDTYGHAAGDDILEAIGKIIKNNIRATDKAFRYGGEEFMVILPETNGLEAIKVAENIRIALAEYEYHPKEGSPIHKTISIGVAEFTNDESLEKVIKRADDNMYRCKIKGKNRVYFSCE